MASPEIEALTQALARIPGLGPRSARRAVLHLLKKREAALAPLLSALAAVEERLRPVRPAAISTPRTRARSVPIPGATRRAAWSRRSRTCGRWSGRGCFRGASMLGGRLSALEGVPEDLAIDARSAGSRARASTRWCWR
jgi:recombination protein RecR